MPRRFPVLAVPALALVALVVAGCTILAPEARAPLPQTQLTILHTNDSRGHLIPYG
jgi:2',3'-cyclic-nucleotide 2'-phosphodiesterase (5'-nucleotidase family)